MKRELKFYPAENTSPKTLSSQDIRQYNAEGYLCPLDVFDDAGAEANRAYFEKLMGTAEAEGLNSYSINGWHSTCEGVWDLVMNDRILNMVEDLLGPNLVCTMSHYFSKPPRDEKRVSWHQDASYWPLTPSKVVTVWLAIDDVDPTMGPMMVIPGSHVHGQIAFEHSTEEEKNVLGQTVTNPEDFGDPVPFVMKAGQVSMHTDLLLHGSEPNASDKRRCGLTLRYMPPDVRGRDPEGQDAIVARGEDESGYWRHIERPVGDAVRRKK